jgi:3-phenylpropionate/trans-cinnamate dioxygenase ferredoxin subunit
MLDVAGLEALTPGQPVRVEAGDVPVCLVSVEGTVHAIHDVCTHAMASLSEGYADGDRIECPRHGAVFSVVTGEPLTPPATRPLPTFRVEVRGDRVLLDPTPSHPHPLT